MLPMYHYEDNPKKKSKHSIYTNADNSVEDEGINGSAFAYGLNLLIQNNESMTEQLTKQENDNSFLNAQISLKAKQAQEFKEEIAEIHEKHKNEAAEYKGKVNRCRELIEDWKKLHGDLEKERDELRQKVNLYEGKSETMNTMSKKQLNALKRTLQETIFGIETAKEQLDECIVCKENEKNVVFVGCGHCVLCKKCADALPNKVCPQCHLEYSDVLIISGV